MYFSFFESDFPCHLSSKYIFKGAFWALNMYLPLSKADFSCNFLFKYIFKSTI